MERLQHSRQGIEPDQVGQRQWTNRLIASQLQPGVYVVSAGQTYHGNKDAVHRKAGTIFYSDWCFTDACSNALKRWYGCCLTFVCQESLPRMP